ncbi:MAG: hypothetical protein J7501_04520 [Bdellovibrio sp.]|nr:hypothetical protein [Bdellovibrio sp.]
MKKLLFLILIAIGFQAHAAAEGENTLQVSGGIRSLNGLVGLNYDRTFGEHHGLQIGTGVDVMGPVVTGGYRYFTGSVSEKCFFFFSCSDKYYGGLSAQFVTPSTINISSGSATSSYATNERWIAVANIGNRMVFSSNVTLDFNFNYKSLLTPSEITNTGGVDYQSDRNLIHTWEQGWGLSMAVGYLF